MSHGDRAAARDQARKPALDRVVEPQPALLDEPEHECRDERLRDAADAEATVGPHRPSRGPVGEAARLDAHGRPVLHDDQRPRRPGVDHMVEQRAQLLPVVVPCGGPADESERRHGEDDRDGGQHASHGCSDCTPHAAHRPGAQGIQCATMS